MPLTEGHLFFCHSLSHFIIAQLLFNQLLRWLNSYLQLVISLSHSYVFATSSPRIMNHSFINNLLFSSITCNNPWLGRSCWQQQVDEQREVRNTEKRDRNEDSTLQENQLILPPKRSGLIVIYEKSCLNMHDISHLWHRTSSLHRWHNSLKHSWEIACNQ